MLSIWTWALLGIVVCLFSIYIFMKHFARKRRPGEPLIVKGSRLLGSATDFSQNAVKFLHSAHRQYGDVFTIRLVNQYLTVIMDPHSYETVAKEKNFDFDPIQKQVNRNVFGYQVMEAKKMIVETSKTVRGQMLLDAIERFADHLNLAYDDLRGSGSPTDKMEDGWMTDGLRRFASRTAFKAIFATVFGRSHQHVFNSDMAFGNFETFHKYFNYLWLGFPMSWFPKAVESLKELLQCPDADELLSRPDLSHYLRRAIEFMKCMGQTELDIKGHNLVYLHVNYNTFRLAFWALNNLLETPAAMEALRQEIEELIEARYDPDTNTVLMNAKDIEGLKVLDSIIQESTRLSSGVFMVRYVTSDTNFQSHSGENFLIREGDRVAIYPPALHKDPEIFEDPLVFKYDRFVDAKFYKFGKEVKHPVMGFGTLCPGKRYALLQLKWYMLTIMTRFELRLREGEHAEYDTQYHGHEILPPIRDVDVHFRQKSEFPVFKFVASHNTVGQS